MTLGSAYLCHTGVIDCNPRSLRWIWSRHFSLPMYLFQWSGPGHLLCQTDNLNSHFRDCSFEKSSLWNQRFYHT